MLPYGQVTVAHSTRTIPIIASSVVAGLLVFTAYVLSGPNPFFTTRVDAKTSEELLKEYAAKDSDADGLPDWQEALYGTDPLVAKSFSPDLTDSEALAQGLLTPRTLATQVSEGKVQIAEGILAAEGTVTDALAKSFFEEYFSRRGSTPPTPDEMNEFAADFLVNFERKSGEFDPYTARDVIVAGEGAHALALYAAAAEAVFDRYEIPTTKNELEYLVDAMEQNDPEAIKMLGDLGAAYSKVGSGLLLVPAPREVASAHLKIATAMKHMGTSVTNMSKVSTDPMAVLLGLDQYTRTIPEYREAFGTLNKAFLGSGVVLSATDAGFDFYQTSFQATIAP